MVDQKPQIASIFYFNNLSSSKWTFPEGMVVFVTPLEIPERLKEGGGGGGVITSLQ